MTAICIFCPVYIENATLLSLRLNIPILNELKANETIICFGCAIDPKKLIDFSIRNPVKYIIINGENINSKYYDPNDEVGRYYIYLQKKYPTFQYSPYTAGYVEKFGIHCAGLVDFEFMNRDNIYSTCEEPIDILFYGFPNEERQRVETLLKNKYPEKNILFAYTVYGNDLLELLVKSKYVLNIPYFEKSALEIHRINQALACGCQVISTKSSCEYLNKKYESKISFVDDWNNLLLE
jgi:hypothetical protein